jgi:hypothetical protein
MTEHTHKASFGKRIDGCPRCTELSQGASPVTRDAPRTKVNKKLVPSKAAASLFFPLYTPEQQAPTEPSILLTLITRVYPARPEYHAYMWENILSQATTEEKALLAAFITDPNGVSDYITVDELVLLTHLSKLTIGKRLKYLTYKIKPGTYNMRMYPKLDALAAVGG